MSYIQITYIKTDYFLTRLAILCKCGFTVLFKAAKGDDGAGEGGGRLLFCDG